MPAKTQTKSRFYIGQTIIETRDTIKKSIDDQTKKHIKARVKTSRKFISDLKKNPVKQLDSLIDDNKQSIKKFTIDSKNRYRTFISDNKITIKKVFKGVSGDAKLFADDIKGFKSKTFDKFTAKNTATKSIEKRINKITARIPSSLNLPSKEEVQELMTGVDGISRKVDKLNKLYA